MHAKTAGLIHGFSRRALGVRLAIVLVVALGGFSRLGAEEQWPAIPVGLDAYRLWDRWAEQRVGARAYMRSTYDRAGGNEAADASHFLYQLSDAFNVTLDVAGPGILYFARYNHWHGSPWHYEVDGSDFVLRETSTANPNHPVPNSVFIPEKLFPNPLTWTWSITKGADLMWVPIPFERSFRMGYERTHYGTGYYIYHQYVPGIELTQPIRTWTQQPPDSEVLELIRRAGSDLLPEPESSEAAALKLQAQSGSIEALLPGEREQVFSLEPGRSMIRALEFSVPRKSAEAFARARLKITWDGRGSASVDAPVALFYGTGTFFNRDNREYLVKAFPVHVRFDQDRVYAACFFPMPFARSARVELIGNPEAELRDVRWRVRWHAIAQPMNQLGYFHATYKDHLEPVPGEDLVLLDTTQIEGGGDWTGQFVGTSWIFTHRNDLTTLEGDPRFFFDDSLSPQAYGTGTEEWGGGGDYWGGLNMTLPFAGHPVGAPRIEDAKNQEDQIHSAYRFLLADLMPFGKNARIQLEHGGRNESREHYETVTYWYGLPGRSLVKTDSLQLGDAESEERHQYSSPEASGPYEIHSRYEWGVDTLTVEADGPRADPKDYAEFLFEADADIPYAVWVRGKNTDGNMLSDAVWIQFDEQIGTDQFTPGCAHPKGFGNWLDRFPKGQYAWSSGVPQDSPQRVTFKTSGTHRLRIQARHPGHVLDMIWLSSSITNLPPQDARPGVRAGEVLLPVSGAMVAGRFTFTDDPGSLSGKALLVQSARSNSVRVVYPPHTDRGRVTRGASEFTMDLRPENVGVLLRRKLDYSYPNQRAEVFVSDLPAGANGRPARWEPAGIWYLAGSNTCVYSNPREELGDTVHIVQTSNRRFREDEFLLPRSLTEGRKAIRIRIQFTPVTIPLFPGHPLPELGWSEIRYDAYCFVRPQFAEP